MKTKSLIIFSTLSTALALSGCTSMFTGTFGTTTERTMLNAEPFGDYDLASETDYKHSDAMQLAYLVSRKAPTKSNDLDRNVDGYTNVSVRATQAANVAAVATTTLNPFQAAFNVIGLQGSLSKMIYHYKRNILFRVIPVDSKDETDIAATLLKNQNELTTIIEKAYLKSSDVVRVEKFVPVEVGLSTFIDTSYVVPLNDEGSVSYCSDPEIFNKFTGYMDSDYEADSHLPISTLNCFGRVEAKGHYYYNNAAGDGTLIPNSDFIIMKAYIPTLFPIDSLVSDNPNDYFYQTAQSYIEDENIKGYLINDINSLKPYWEQGYFSPTPKIIKLSTQETLKFGQQ
ncbi:hypothetical protein AB6D85_09710 [Vibrio splendidus]